MATRDSWATESGLLDNYDMVVDEAWFGQDPSSDDDERIFLFLRGDAVDEEGEEHEAHTERYSTGKNWEVVEDGAEVENATGRHKFNQNAGIGRLINALVALGEKEATFLSERGDTFESKTYKGLKLHMESREVSKWTNDDGDEVVWRLNLPTKIDMKKGGKGGKGKASRSDDTPTDTKAKGKADKKAKTSKPSGLRAAILEFAAQFAEDEHDEFVDQILDDSIFDKADDILDNDELHAEVLDPDSDLWTSSH